MILFQGCSKIPNAQKKTSIDPTLPVVVINGTLKDMNAIAFEWKPLDDPRIKGVYIYRNDPKTADKKLLFLDAVENRFATHYVDTSVEPGTLYHYRFASYNAKKEQSKPSKDIIATTLPQLESVSYFTSIDAMPRTAKLIWRPHTNAKVISYILERKSGNDAKYKKIATIKGRLNAEYIDHNLKDNKIYFYRLFAHTFDDLTSKASAEVRVTTKELPKKVQVISATADLPRKITLAWRPNAEKDIAYYKIYRNESASGSFDYHVKLNQAYFTDKITEDGKSYFYQITAVDTDGLESPNSELLKGKTPERPMAPQITSATISAILESSIFPVP